MAKKGSFSKVYDKNGDYVDVEAARFDGTRTFQMQGDVTASQTWNGDSASALTLNTSIGAKKVTTDKINDKAVQTGQIDDGAVGLTQIATNAMNGTVQDNDSKLATHAAVKTYVDSQISGQGTYLGKHTVAEINAMVTDNLHNGDRVMTSDSGTINLGPGGVGFDVEAGEDLILYKSGSTVQWDSMDGNFKTKQSAVDDPTASGTGLTFIDSASQDENGEMTLSKKAVQDGTTSQKGVVQLEDSHSSTSTTKAATPKNVKEAYDLANTANTGAVKNVAYDSTNKKITKTINGQTTDVVSAATLKTDMDLNNVDNTSDANKPVSTAQQAALDLKLDKTGDGKDVTATFTEASTRANIGTGEKLSVIFGKIKKWFTDLGTAAFKNVPASGNASSTEVVLGSDTRLSAGASAVQDVTVDGASVVNSSTKVAAVPNASTSAKGAVQLAGSIGSTVASENNKAATEKAVRDAINALDAEVTSNDGTNVQVKVTEADGKISAVNVTTDNTENRNNKVTSVRAASSATDTAYPSEKAVATALNAKADANKVVAIADAVVSRTGTTGWFKVAERAYNQVTSTVGGTWAVTIISASKNITCHYTIDLNIRAQTSGTNAAVRIFSSSPLGLSASDNYDNFRCVLNGTSGSLTIELWYYAGGPHESMMLSELATGVYNGSNTKFGWTYYNISSSTAGSETAPTGNVVKDIDFVYAQKPVVNPTNDNLVAMDANGLIKDSGLTKSSVESAITSAGSAIQGVKVNNITLTPDANKVVTVPLATTSADGAMSAADKTKLDGIAAGAEVNVQADWNQTSSSADSFVKNKPSYVKYVDASPKIFRICSFYKASSTSSSTLGVDLLMRCGGTGVKASLVIRNDYKLFCQKTSGEYLTNSGCTRLYVVEGAEYGILYASCGTYNRLFASPSCLAPKDRLNFDNFGTEVDSLPEGATEITPVWVANSASSSGTAPVKVDAYGALTPVPMDSTPTASSTNLMTSGDIKTAIDAVSANVFPWYRTGSGGGTAQWMKVCDILLPELTNYSGYIYKFDYLMEYNTTIATSKSGSFELHVRTRGANNPEYLIYVRKDTGPKASQVYPSLKLYKKVDGGKQYLTIAVSAGGVTYNGIATRIHGCVNQGGYLVNHHVTMATNTIYTVPSDYTEVTNVVTDIVPVYSYGTAVGSTSIPTYVNSNGAVEACTDDFVHDGDVAQAYSSTSEAPISGKGVKDAITKGSPVEIATNADFDELLPSVDYSKFYSLNGTFTNGPSGASSTGYWGVLLVSWRNHCPYQFYINWSSTGATMYTRYSVTYDSTTGKWTNWQNWVLLRAGYDKDGYDIVSTYLKKTDGLTDVAYAANASGGGGNLNKTKNGSTTSVLAFMTTAEAHSLWQNAKANAS